MSEVLLDVMGRRGAGKEWGHSHPLGSPGGWMEVGGCGMGSDLWLLAAHWGM